MEINSITDLNSALKENKRIFLLLYKSGTTTSDCALENLLTVKDKINVPILLADVNMVRDIHSVYGITSVPGLLEFNEGSLKNIYKGCQTASFYLSAITGKGFSTINSEEGKAAKRVVVYTTPSCTWCNTIKTYLKEKKISFLEVNVAANPAKAEEMVKKSGQQGVPQTEINGRMVVGFDKNRLNDLLEIR